MRSSSAVMWCLQAVQLFGFAPYYHCANLSICPETSIEFVHVLFPSIDVTGGCAFLFEQHTTAAALLGFVNLKSQRYLLFFSSPPSQKCETWKEIII